ncbi:MAG: hypothetical protein HUJ91_06210 [Bacteroidales bacterium]|nr:hypothetical protein [Bacteroidales bacterium]
MDKYILDVLVRNRIEILNRVTNLFIVKNLPVQSVLYSVTSNDMAIINLICFCPDEEIMKRIIRQANNIVDISEVYYTKVFKTISNNNK